MTKQGQIKKVKFETTLTLLKKAKPCSDGLKTLLQSLPQNYSETKSINLLHILESNGVQHFFWALRTLKLRKSEHKEAIRCILADIVELVEPNYSKFDPTNPSIKDVIKYLRKGTVKQLRIAAESAESARRAAESAAWSARRAAESARRAAESAAWSARRAAESARRAAESAAWNAVNAAWGAVSAARSAAWSAVSAAWSVRSTSESVDSAAEQQQKEIIKKYLK